MLMPRIRKEKELRSLSRAVSRGHSVLQGERQREILRRCAPQNDRAGCGPWAALLVLVVYGIAGCAGTTTDDAKICTGGLNV